HPEDKRERSLLLREMIDDGRVIPQMERRYIRKDGQVVWGLATASVVRDGEGNPIYVATQLQDITEFKRIQKGLQDYAKMVTLGEMSANIAHEINNPLTIIGLHSTLISEMLKGEELEREMIE